jgi:LysM repeat protein
MPVPLLPVVEVAARFARLVVVLALAAAVLEIGGSATPVAHASSNCGAPGAHQVVRGDTWFGIARAAGVSMRSVLRANGATEGDVLHPGDVVCLPAGAATSPCTPANAPTYTVQRHDTWWGIAQRAGTSVPSLRSANSTSGDTIRPGQTVCLPMGRPIHGATAAPTTNQRPAASSSFRLDALPLHGPCWFSDDFGHPRGGGRRHAGNDLFAAPGNYVYAVVDGTLTNRSWEQPGRRAGNAWWLTAADGSGTYYFYAHLDDFAPGLKVGSRVKAGESIGFMGNTGNSAFPHLHFEVHPGGGAAVDPYPALRALGGCKTGSGYRQPNGWAPD